jgi:hypothetical protein
MYYSVSVLQKLRQETDQIQWIPAELLEELADMITGFSGGEWEGVISHEFDPLTALCQFTAE